jgi:hypothetical protein
VELETELETQQAFYIWHDTDPGFIGEWGIEVGWGWDDEHASENSFTFPREELEALIEFLEEQLTMVAA